MRLRCSMGCLLATALVLALGAVITTTGSAPAGAAGIASVSCDPVAAGPTVTAPPLASFSATAPQRLIDTRDGTGGVQAPIGADCTLRMRVESSVAPADAHALSLSVTALGRQPGFLSVFPCESGLPATSNLNSRQDGFPTPNLVIALPDTNRDICIYSQFETDVLIDLTGWWTEQGDARFTSIPPVRVDDSRNDPGRPWVPAGSVRTVDLAGVVPAGTSAVVANLTVTEPLADGFIAAFPCGTPVPGTSNLNFRARESRAVAIVVGVDDESRLCLRSIVDHHVIVDISGYYSPTPQFGPSAGLHPLAGRRLADSRGDDNAWSSKFTEGTIRRLRPAADLTFEAQATAAVLNVVATEADAPGFVTVYPCDKDLPTTSVLNFGTGEESTNLVTVDLSAAGEVCFFTSSGVHLVVDLFGLMAAPVDSLVERLQFNRHTWPPFSPDGTDYAVECGDQPVDLTIDLLTGTSARVNGLAVGPGTLDVSVGDDDLTWVQLRRGATTRNHWFRCVPSDFARLNIDRSGDPAPGWYLTTLRTGPEQRTFAVILDERGAPVWYKRLSEVMIDFKRRNDGRLLLTPSLGPRYGVRPDHGYQILTLSGTLLDEHLTVDDPADPGVEYPTDHHDYVPLAGGARAMLSYPLLGGQDLTVLGDGYLADDTIADGVIQEIDADGTLVWSWRTSDNFGYDEVTFPQRWEPAPDYVGGEVDVFHLNSLGATDDGSGDYVVSARHLDAVFRVDRTDGDLDWILGSLPPATPNKVGAQRLMVVNDPFDGPLRPHDARLAGDVLTLFDNRTGSGQPARAVAYRIDTAAGTATLLWQITEPEGRSSGSLGSTRVASDGSVLVLWGALQPMIEEYDADHNNVLRMTQVGGGVSYRVVKEPPSAFSAAVLRATAGGAAESP